MVEFIVLVWGLLIAGCGGEIATYRFAKEGNDAYTAADYDTALEKWQAGLEQAQLAKNKKDMGMFLYNIGLVYDRLSQYQEALDYYQQALSIRRETGDKSGEGNVLNNIGIVYGKLSRYQEALDSYRQALELKRATGNQQDESSTLNNIGAIYWNLGQYQEALEQYQQALEIKRATGDKAGQGNTLNNIGGVYESQGGYQEALDYYQQALALRREIADKQGEGSTLNNIGVIYWNLGQYQEALTYYQQALALRREIADKHGEGSNLNNIGVVFWKLGKYDHALDYYQQSLAIRRAIRDKRGEGSVLTNIGVVYDSQQQYQESLAYYQQALEIRRTIGDRRGEGFTLTKVGEVYAKLGRYQEAYEAFQTSIEINQALGTIDTLWMAQRGLAAVEVQLKQPEAAVTHYEQALDTIELLRAGLAETEYKLSFIQDKLKVYDELIELLRTLHQRYPDKGYDRKALEIFERKQGRVFLEEVGKSGARFFAGLPESVRQHEEQLETQLDRLREELAAEQEQTQPNQKRIQDLERQQQTLHAEQKALQLTIKKDYPEYAALRYPEPVTMTDLQNQVLRSGELMLVYNVMEGQTVLWLISPDSVRLYTLPVGEKTLQEQIYEMRDLMFEEWGMRRGLGVRTETGKKAPEQPEGLTFGQASQALYTLLIPEDVRSLLTDQHTLSIVPTGPLYILPFEALVTSPQPQRYLIEDVPISYLSSASLLKTLREASMRSQTPAQYPVLAFAHPVYSVEASAGTRTLRGLRSEAYREVLGGGLAELPETAEEAQAVAEIFHAPEDAAAIQLRRDASRAKVFAFNADKRLADYRYLLFAMHGVLPGEVSRLRQSALILSDDFLTTADVFSLKLNAGLVALSACNTGRGEQVRGEGIIGLTRAFMYAGTPAVAVTLWSVESLSAKTLSIGMFRYLQEGYAPASALRTIKMRMLRGEEGQDYFHPYYWAPYVVFGDGR